MSKSSPENFVGANHSHNLLNAGLIVTALFSFIITAIFNGLAGSGSLVGTLFYATIGNASDKYQLYITPAGNKKKLE